MTAASGCLRGVVHRLGQAVNGYGKANKFAPFKDIGRPLSRLIHSFHVEESWVLGCRRCRFIKRTVSISVEVLFVTPRFAILNYSTGTQEFISAPDFISEEEVTDEALNKLLSAVKTDPNAFRDIGSTYAVKLCKAGSFTALARLLQALRENRIILYPNVYNVLLLAAGEANDADLLLQTLKDILVSDSLDSTSYVSIAKAFMKTTDRMPLVQFVQDVADLTPTTGVIVLNRIIYSLAGCGQVDKALLIYDNMKSLMCKPDLITYNTVLGILGRTGHMDEMLREFSCMKENGIYPDLVSYNTVINSLKKVGRLDLCLKYLKEMTENGLKADLRTYTALIESFGRLGNVEESVMLFDEMKVSGIRPSIYIYRSLIDNLKKAGKVEVAVKYLEEMKSHYEYLVGPKDFKRKNR